MCPCMFVQKKENKCLFFIFVTACLKKKENHLMCLFSLLPYSFYKTTTTTTTTVFNLLPNVRVRVKKKK